MKVDVYTKVVLTVIAVCLVILTLHNVSMVSPVQAAPGTALSNDFPSQIDVRVVSMPSLEVSPKWNAFPVEVKR